MAARPGALSNESVPEDRMSLQRFIDMRYLGQWRSMSIPIDAPVTSLDRASTQSG